MMNSKRVYLALWAGIGLLVAGLLAGTYGINQSLGKEAQKLTTYKAQSQARTQEQTSLKIAKQDLERFAELDKIAKIIVPEDKNQAATVREIVNIAAANNIQLASITFPASSLGSNVPAAGSATTAPKPAPVNSKAGDLSQLQPVKTIPGIYLLSITVNGDPKQPVRYNEFITFLTALERNRRTAQVTNITLQPDTNNPNLLTFSLTLNQYIKP